MKEKLLPVTTGQLPFENIAIKTTQNIAIKQTSFFNEALGWVKPIWASLQSWALTELIRMIFFSSGFEVYESAIPIERLRLICSIGKNGLGRFQHHNII